MAKPETITTRIFLDSGDPEETKEIIDLLEFLDGQTTNPSLIVKEMGNSKNSRSTEKQLLSSYQKIVSEISEEIPHGSVSIEVYADQTTTTHQMVTQGKEMFAWIPNSHIKLPLTSEGLHAAHELVNDSIRVNMTLVFCQEQAAAVYAATKGASRGEVFVSPFEGRLHDLDEDGMDLITNIQKMYKKQGDGHVEVLAASIRDHNHFLYTLYAGVDIVTAPFNVLKEWGEKGMPVPGVDIPNKTFENENQYLHKASVKDIPFEKINLQKDWREYNINHPLTDGGLQKFADDWNALIR